MTTTDRIASIVTQRQFSVHNSDPWAFAGSSPPTTLAEGVGASSGANTYLLGGELIDSGAMYSQLLECSGWDHTIPLFSTGIGVSLRATMRDDFGAGGTYYGNSSSADGEHRAYNTLLGDNYDDAAAGGSEGIRCSTLSVLGASRTVITHNTWRSGDITAYLTGNAGRLNSGWTHGIVVWTDDVGPEHGRVDTVKETITWTAPAAPDAFTLSAPADSATGVSRTPTLTWNASTRAVYYRVRVSANADMSSPIVDANTTAITIESQTGDTSYAVPTPLAANTLYYWRVDAVNYAGIDDTSPQTTACTADRSFTTASGRTRGGKRSRGRSRARASDPADYL